MAAALDTALAKFDASKEKVRKEIREGFFEADGELRISEAELRAWVADRAVDELKIVLQLSHVLSKGAHLLPAHILTRLTEQIADEARHHEILRSLMTEDLHEVIDAKVTGLPGALAADEHWKELRDAVDQGNPFAALIDINIVHDGYSAAAIEELKDIPFDDIRTAYAEIGVDEEKHHQSGRDLLLWLTGAVQSYQTDITTKVVGNAHERAVDGGAMSWSWP